METAISSFKYGKKIKISAQSLEAVVVATVFLHNVVWDMNSHEPPVDDDVLRAIVENEVRGVYFLEAPEENVDGPNNVRCLALIRDNFQI